MRIADNFIRCYPVSKTLQFKLIPMFETEENLNKYNIVSEDEEKAHLYVLAKPVLDKCHRQYISKSLSAFECNWEFLYEALIKAQRDRDTSEYEKVKAEYQKAVSKHLKSGDGYAALKPKAIIDSVIKDSSSAWQLTEEEKEVLKSFNRFATYFEGYRQTRENVYSFGIASSIAYRVIEENFPKFVADVKLFQSVSDELKGKWNEALSPLLNGISLYDLFSPNGFKNVLTQEGIDFFNAVLGGVSISETEKLQGLNELCNLAWQEGILNKKIKFTALFKQILSDRAALSFLPMQFTSDKELLNAVNDYSAVLFDYIYTYANELQNAFDTFDCRKIYVDKKQISFLSQLAYDGNWAMLKALISEAKIKKSSYYTLDILNTVSGKDLLAALLDRFEVCYHEVECAFDKCLATLSKDSIESYDGIKEYLDSVEACERTLKILAAPNDAEKDNAFYSVFDELYSVFRNVIPLYNMVRNYATKKPFSTEKFKLNFECPTLSNGWDQNKEYANNTVLFMKNGYYYIGIFNAKAKVRLIESETPSEGAYRKMKYKLLPDPSKMLPKVFFSKKGLEAFDVSDYILEGYKRGLHKKGDSFDLKFCHDLIDFFKDSISRHPDWSKFGFVFSPTECYNDTSDFYREITKHAYKISFSYVGKEQIEELVKNGNLFLFRLYNKDYSAFSKGRKNLFTLYWEEVFSEKNLADPVFKLNGQAELFYRPASVENPFVHKKGSVLISKNDSDGIPVPEEIYISAKADAESGMSRDLLVKKYPAIVFKTAEYDIIKDKRYTGPQFSFHVPITMNYGADNKYPRFNDAVLHALSSGDDYNIIGIDRGERNLIYISVIDQRGNILKQKSFNIVKGVDYRSKLDEREHSRDSARKSWKSIGSIKEMKEGYLSAVVKEICDMMIEYNAVVVLEDLNFGFKRGRFHIEKQVYQKFEKQLIDKLNFFADKTKDADTAGSIRKAYQLTGKFESFQKLGKQSGFLFYVPAAYTSKIDPVTGFVNLFTSKQLNYKSVDVSREFINSFDGISYDSQYGFRFDFRYSHFDLFKVDYTDKWSVYSYGENRIAHTKKDGYDTLQRISVTERLEELLNAHNIGYKSGEDLRESLAAVNDTGFFKTFLWLFKTIVQLRYEDAENDFILSPVLCDGSFFDSRCATENKPIDGDANGAYHIALQGLRMLSRVENGKIKPDEKNKQAYNWFEFVQSKPYRF